MRLFGAVIGDISGSWYEFRGYKQRPATLVTQRDFFTDDSVLTLAVAEGMLNGFEQVDRAALMEDEDARATFRLEIVKSICAFAHRYPDAGYGNTFIRWYADAYERQVYQPYNSWGNGSAMRASFAGWAAQSLEEALLLGKLSAEVTHDHPEGIKGAQAIAAGIYLLRSGKSKADVRDYLSQLYDLDFTLDEIRPSYRFEVSCQKSVPQAINAFLEAVDFVDTLKNALSLGGDADTLAAMAGSLAEACYPIPADLEARAWAKLTPDLQAVLRRANEFLQ